MPRGAPRAEEVEDGDRSVRVSVGTREATVLLLVMLALGLLAFGAMLVFVAFCDRV